MNMLIRNYRAWGEIRRRYPFVFWLAWGGVLPLLVAYCMIIGAQITKGQSSTGTTSCSGDGCQFNTWNITIGGPVAEISAAGDVTIDWPAAETMRAREYVGYDPTTVAVVRLMFAVRDGTWKPREPK